MRINKILTLLFVGLLTFSSLNSWASTKSIEIKPNISTKKKVTAKKVANITKKASSKVIKKKAVKKKSAQKQKKYKTASRKYFQTGIASYYANMFNGRRTANGEIFSNKKMTAAHRTLPFGTLIEVTNLRNGRSVIVRINDRGPYVHPRVVDLSSAAAKKIGMYHSGIAKVKIAILNKKHKS